MLTPRRRWLARRRAMGSLMQTQRLGRHMAEYKWGRSRHTPSNGTPPHMRPIHRWRGRKREFRGRGRHTGARLGWGCGCNTSQPEERLIARPSANRTPKVTRSFTALVMDAGGLLCILSLAPPKGHAVCGVRTFSSTHERSVCGPEYYTVWHSAVKCQKKRGSTPGTRWLTKMVLFGLSPGYTPDYHAI